MTNEQAQRLATLAKRRQSEKLPCGYSDVSRFYGGGYDDCKFVSPWTKSAHNVHNRLMIIAQDWASEDYLKKEPFNQTLAKQGFDQTFETNKCLCPLLRDYMGLDFSQTYSTNVFPFIKPGKISAPIPWRLLKKFAKDYALPEIKIVDPLIVICLGIKTFSAIYAALPEQADVKTKPLTWTQYKEKEPTFCSSEAIGKIEIRAVTHLGVLGKMHRREEIPGEWRSAASQRKKLRDARI